MALGAPFLVLVIYIEYYLNEHIIMYTVIVSKIYLAQLCKNKPQIKEMLNKIYKLHSFLETSETTKLISMLLGQQ
jgi:hypothetical protein